jgi:hypothetical protein
MISAPSQPMPKVILDVAERVAVNSVLSLLGNWAAPFEHACTKMTNSVHVTAMVTAYHRTVEY